MKRYIFLIIMFTALVMLLGHNLIPHHHHLNSTSDVSGHLHPSDHHHSHDRLHTSDHLILNGHQHSRDCEQKGENNNSVLDHLFSHFQHGEIVYLNNKVICKIWQNQINSILTVSPEGFVVHRFSVIVPHHWPRHKAVFRVPYFFLPTGLRAPPEFIV